MIQRNSSTPLIQRAFDAETITQTINEDATEITRLGGTRDGAYRIVTNSVEHPVLVIKATEKIIPVVAAEMAQEVGVTTPETISVSAAGILGRVKKLNKALGTAMDGLETVVVQKYVDGVTLDQGPDLRSERVFSQIGQIASFDMMIGKRDLFNNYDPSQGKAYNEQNFKNIMFTGHGRHTEAVDIDLDTGGDKGNILDSNISIFNEESFVPLKKTQREIVLDILKDPTTLSPYIEGNIGGMLSEGAGVSLVDPLARFKGMGDPRKNINGLKVQQGMMEMIAQAHEKQGNLRRILKKMPEGGKFDAIREMVAFYDDVGERARAAVRDIELKIAELEEEGRALEMERQREKEPKGKKKTKSSKGKGCFLTTACVEYKGLADDCEELTVLRAFRDNYMANLSNGQRMVQEYYALAPTIVRCIWEDEDYALILEEMYQVVRQCVAFIRAEQPERALHEYGLQVLRLKERYLAEAG